jgi:hypothetical protein
VSVASTVELISSQAPALPDDAMVAVALAIDNALVQLRGKLPRSDLSHSLALASSTSAGSPLMSGSAGAAGSGSFDLDAESKTSGSRKRKATDSMDFDSQSSSGSSLASGFGRLAVGSFSPASSTVSAFFADPRPVLEVTLPRRAGS